MVFRQSAGPDLLQDATTPTFFRKDPFIGSLTIDCVKSADHLQTGLFRMMSHQTAPKHTSFASKFQNHLQGIREDPSSKVDSDNYRGYKLKSSLANSASVTSLPRNMSLSKLLSSQRPKLVTRTNPDEIVINGRPATSLPSSEFHRKIKTRVPRQRRPERVSEGVGPVSPSADLSSLYGSSDVQDELQRRWLRNSESIPYQGMNHSMSSYSDSDSGLKSPKPIFDFENQTSPLGDKPFRRNTIKLQYRSTNPDSSQPISKQKAVRFDVKVTSNKPQADWKLKKAHRMTAALSPSHLGLRSIHLN